MDHEGGTGRYLHFHFLSSLGIGEAGPAKDTTAFGLSFFLFFSMSCICTIRGRHRPPPQRNLREAVVVFLLSHCTCIVALCWF